MEKTKTSKTYSGVTTSRLNMRERASLESGVMCVIPNGATVEFSKTNSKKWYKVNFGGKTGYSMSEYIVEK